MTSHDIIFFCNERSYFQKNILRKIFFFSYKMDKTTFMKNILHKIFFVQTFFFRIRRSL